jgi:hypothetical protein
MSEPNVELAADFLTAGYYLVIDGKPIRPENGVGTWATRGEALEAWEAIATNPAPQHEGPCCNSCEEDKATGYGDDIEGCCCRAIYAANEDGDA